MVSIGGILLVLVLGFTVLSMVLALLSIVFKLSFGIVGLLWNLCLEVLSFLWRYKVPLVVLGAAVYFFCH